MRGAAWSALTQQASQPLPGRASLIPMTVLGGGDSESMTGLLCTYYAPGTTHASSPLHNQDLAISPHSISQMCQLKPVPPVTH